MKRIVAEIEKSTVYHINERMVKIEIRGGQGNDLELIYISDNEHTIAVTCEEMRALIVVLTEIENKLE